MKVKISKLTFQKVFEGVYHTYDVVAKVKIFIRTNGKKRDQDRPLYI